MNEDTVRKLSIALKALKKIAPGMETEDGFMPGEIQDIARDALIELEHWDHLNSRPKS